MTPEHANQTGTAEPEFWQSVDRWMDSPKFRDDMQNEFPDDAAEWIDPVSRRQFLTLMGASVALAGAIGCNPSLKPASQRKVLPYVVQPTEILPNVPLFFATAMPQASLSRATKAGRSSARGIRITRAASAASNSRRSRPR